MINNGVKRNDWEVHSGLENGGKQLIQPRDPGRLSPGDDPTLGLTEEAGEVR